MPFGFPIVNHGIAKKYPLYVGDLAEGLTRIIRLNSDLVTGKTFELFGYNLYVLYTDFLFYRPTQYTYKEIIELFCYLSCRPNKTINLPPLLLTLYARMYPEWRRFVYTKDLINVVSTEII